MPREAKLTARQKLFCREYAKTGNAAKAMIACGYSPKTADRKAHLMVGKSQVAAEIKRLSDKAEDHAICDIRERKVILSEIARAEFTDYAECSKDGAWVSAGKESPNRKAIKKFTSRTDYDKDGSAESVTTSLDLHDKSQAIDLLNKMEHVYIEKHEHTGPDGGPIPFMAGPIPAATIADWEKQCRAAKRRRAKAV